MAKMDSIIIIWKIFTGSYPTHSDINICYRNTYAWFFKKNIINVFISGSGEQVCSMSHFLIAFP